MIVQLLPELVTLKFVATEPVAGIFAEVELGLFEEIVHAVVPEFTGKISENEVLPPPPPPPQLTCSAKYKNIKNLKIFLKFI